MAQRSSEARRMRRELDKQLAAVSAATRQKLTWTPEEAAVLDMISNAFDRKTLLEARLPLADDDKALVKLSGEIRLLEGHAARLLKSIRIQMPRPRPTATEPSRRGPPRTHAGRRDNNHANANHARRGHLFKVEGLSQYLHSGGEPVTAAERVDPRVRHADFTPGIDAGSRRLLGSTGKCVARSRASFGAGEPLLVPARGMPLTAFPELATVPFLSQALPVPQEEYDERAWLVRVYPDDRVEVGQSRAQMQEQAGLVSQGFVVAGLTTAAITFRLVSIPSPVSGSRLAPRKPSSTVAVASHVQPGRSCNRRCLSELSFPVVRKRRCAITHVPRG